MSSSESPSPQPLKLLLRSMARQPGAVAGLVLVGVGYVAFLGVMRARSDDLAERFLARYAQVRQQTLEALAREVAAQPGAALPLEWSLPALGREPHTRTVGFSHPEDWGLWTQEPEASLVVHLAEAPQGPLVLQATARAYLQRALARQRVEVLANGTPVASWTFSLGEGDREVEARIPAGLLRAGEPLQLTFRMPDARAPLEVQGHGDPRRLGLGLVRLRLAPAPRG